MSLLTNLNQLSQLGQAEQAVSPTRWPSSLAVARANMLPSSTSFPWRKNGSAWKLSNTGIPNLTWARRLSSLFSLNFPHSDQCNGRNQCLSLHRREGCSSQLDQGHSGQGAAPRGSNSLHRGPSLHHLDGELNGSSQFTPLLRYSSRWIGPSRRWMTQSSIRFSENYSAALCSTEELSGRASSPWSSKHGSSTDGNMAWTWISSACSNSFMSITYSSCCS